jgi:hypothetical protein
MGLVLAGALLGRAARRAQEVIAENGKGPHLPC